MNKDLIHHELLKDLSKGRNSYYVCINRTTHWYNNIRKVDENKIIDKNSIVLYTGDDCEIFYPFIDYFGVNYKMSDFRLLTDEEYDYYIVNNNDCYKGDITTDSKFKVGDVVYPTREGVETYPDQLSGVKKGTVCGDLLNGWFVVRWGNGERNDYEIKDITKEISKSVFEVEDTNKRPPSSFDEHLNSETLDFIWKEVSESGYKQYEIGSLSGCFVFAKTEQGHDFWSRFLGCYSRREYKTCEQLVLDYKAGLYSKDKPKKVDQKDYKLKESDLIGSFKDYPLEVAQEYYDLCIKYGKKESDILKQIQDNVHYGFGWEIETKKSGIKWREIREYKYFSSYYNIRSKSKNVTDKVKSEHSTNSTIEIGSKEVYSEKPILKDTDCCVDPYDLTKDTFSSCIPTMKRFQKKKKFSKTVSEEINVKGLRKKPKSNN